MAASPPAYTASVDIAAAPVSVVVPSPPQPPSEMKDSPSIPWPTLWIPTLGQVQGSVENLPVQSYPIVSFLNVPFATVTQRWRPAVKPEPWEGIRDATNYGYRNNHHGALYIFFF